MSSFGLKSRKQKWHPYESEQNKNVLIILLMFHLLNVSIILLPMDSKYWKVLVQMRHIK